MHNFQVYHLPRAFIVSLKATRAAKVRKAPALLFHVDLSRFAHRPLITSHTALDPLMLRADTGARFNCPL